MQDFPLSVPDNLLFFLSHSKILTIKKKTISIQLFSKLTSFTVATLVALRAAADARRSAAAVVHALRVAQRRSAVLSDVALLTLADLVLVAPATVCTLLVTLRVRPY